MQLLRLQDGDQRDQREFDRFAEVAMDCHLAQSQGKRFYLVIGGRVAIFLNERTFTEPDYELFEQSWLRGGLSEQERIGRFENWLGGLDTAPGLSVSTPLQAWRSWWNAFSPVTPNVPLPRPPTRLGSIYGHLPFFTTRASGNAQVLRNPAFYIADFPLPVRLPHV